MRTRIHDAVVPPALAALTALALAILTPALALACRPAPDLVTAPAPTTATNDEPVLAHEPPYWHPHPPHVITPPIHPYSFDDVMRTATPTMNACMSRVGTWIHRVDVEIAMTRWGSELYVTSTPHSSTVTTCARSALQSAGLAQVMLYDGARWTFVNPWSPPPPPPPPVVTTTVETIIADHDHRFDACRLGEPDGTRWTLTFDVAPDGAASSARAWPEDDVGACLIDVVERIDFSAAHTTGRASVTVAP